MLSASKQLGYKPGENVFIGGIDWSKDALEAIQRRELTASVGGHFFEGAWALVLLHDYINGRDFADIDGVTMKTNMQLVDKTNVSYWQSFIDKKRWDNMDFRSFSLATNRKLDKYGNPPAIPMTSEVEFSKKEVLREEVKIYRQPNHGCSEAY
jgi:hypothetical protein